MKLCESCHAEHDGSYGSGRFCRLKCARGFATAAKRKEINEKVSRTLTAKYPMLRICTFCNKEFRGPKTRRFCSRSCRAKFQWHRNPAARAVIASTLNKHRSKGWAMHRQESYPERWWRETLTQHVSVPFQQEMFISRKPERFGCFLDFYFPTLKLDLEIDGKFHREQITEDTERDNFLRDQGMRVVRYPWIDAKTAWDQFCGFQKMLV